MNGIIIRICIALTLVSPKTTPCSPLVKQLPPIPTWEEAAAAVFDSSSEASLVPPTPSPKTTPCSPPVKQLPPTPTWEEAAAAVFDSSSEVSLVSPTPSPKITPAPAETLPPSPIRRRTRSMTASTRNAMKKACNPKQHQQTRKSDEQPKTQSGTQVKSKRFQPKPSVRPKKVLIAKSQIPGAGLGLYLLEDAAKGEFVARYSGEAIDKTENEARTSHYRIKISKNLYLDAEEKHHFEGRYINDGKRAGKIVNVRFAAGYRTNTCSTTNHQWIRIFATRNIKAGEELYLDYGDDFWMRVSKPTQAPLSQPGSSSTPPNVPLASTHKPTSQLNPTPMTTLSPIRHTSNRLQRTPPMSGILLLQPPSPWAPTTSPPRILGHHNPHTSPTQQTHTNTHNTQHQHTRSHTLILNDSPTLNDHSYTHTHQHPD